MATDNDTAELEQQSEETPHVKRFARACTSMAMASTDMSDEEYHVHMDEAVLQGAALLDTGQGFKAVELKLLIDVGIECASTGSWSGRLDAYVECDVLIRKGKGDKAMYALGKNAGKAGPPLPTKKMKKA